MGSQNVFLWPPSAPKYLFSLPKGGLARVATPDFLNVSQSRGEAARRRRHPAPRPTALCDAQHGGRCHPPLLGTLFSSFLRFLGFLLPLTVSLYTYTGKAELAGEWAPAGGIEGGREGVGSVVAVKCL